MDTLSPRQRSRQMARVRSRDTGPEMVVRRLLHRAGFRYRLHAAELPGAPDVVFPARRKVIFVHGCFWHRHAGCPRNRTPKSHRAFWVRKLTGNRRRDQRNLRRLRRLGWSVAVVWECETGATTALERRLRRFLGGR